MKLIFKVCLFLCFLAFSGFVVETMIHPSQIMQAGAGDNQAIAWNSGKYAPSEFVKATSQYSEDGIFVVENPQGGSRKYQSATVTGAIRIKVPDISLTMLDIDIDVHDYNSELSFEVSATGYMLANAWIADYSARIEGINIDADRTIRWANDGNDKYIIIGEITDVWSYPSVSVSKVIGSFTNASLSGLSSGWGVEIINSLTGLTIQREIEDNLGAASVSNVFFQSTLIDNPDSINARIIQTPEGGKFQSDAASLTGVIRIAFPVDVPIGSMAQMTFNCYNYDAQKSFKAIIQGYVNNAWLNNSNQISATVIGSNEQANFPMRFIRESDRQYVYIGETSSIWNYPSLAIEEIRINYNGADSEAKIKSWSKGWEVSVESSIVGTATTTLTDNFPAASKAKTNYWTEDSEGVYYDGRIGLDEIDDVYLESESTGELSFFANALRKMKFALAYTYLADNVIIGFDGAVDSKLHITQGTADKAFSAGMAGNKSKAFDVTSESRNYVSATTTTTDRKVELGHFNATNPVLTISNYNLQVEGEIIEKVQMATNATGNIFSSIGTTVVERENAWLLAEDSNTNTHIQIEIDATTEVSPQSNIIIMHGYINGTPFEAKRLLTFSNAAVNSVAYGMNTTPATLAVNEYESTTGKPVMEITITGATLEDTVIPISVRIGKEFNGVSDIVPKISRVVVNTGADI